MKAKLLKLIEHIRKNPRYIFLLAALIVQLLEAADIVVNPEMVEVSLDVVTIIILGRVMKKSETDNIV